MGMQRSSDNEGRAADPAAPDPTTLLQTLDDPTAPDDVMMTNTPVMSRRTQSALDNELRRNTLKLSRADAEGK